jgi:CRP/FNR family transcriptional regulator
LRLFCNLTPDALREFDSIGRLTGHPGATRLFGEGEAAQQVHVLCSGQVKLSTCSREGKTLIVKIAGPGDVLGLNSMLGDAAYEVTAETMEPCRVKTMGKEEFLAFLTRNGNASLHAAQALSAEYMTVFRDAKRLALAGSAAGRLAQLLMEWGRSAACGRTELRFTMALTHEEIASMVGVSRETVTRLLNRFRREKIIRIQGATLTILQPEAMEQMSA